MAEINCGTCASYQPRHATPEAQDRAEAAGHAVSSGFCICNPQRLPKNATDSCSQHSELILNRMLTQADMIAIALVKQNPSLADRLHPRPRSE